MKLLLGKTVHTLDFLLFTQLDAIVRDFSAATLSMLAGNIAPPIKRAFIRKAPVSFKEEL
jgi:hypothetical protein